MATETITDMVRETTMTGMDGTDMVVNVIIAMETGEVTETVGTKIVAAVMTDAISVT